MCVEFIFFHEFEVLFVWKAEVLKDEVINIVNTEEELAFDSYVIVVVLGFK